MSNFFREQALRIACAAAYVLLAYVSLKFATIQANASPVWPPTGLAIALLWVGGTRLWPAILLGAFVANQLFTPVPVWVSFFMGLGNTLEAWVAVTLAKQIADGNFPFSQRAGTIRFVLIAGVYAPLFSATIGVTSLWLANLLPGELVYRVWLTWWLGDAAGAILVAPLLMAFMQKPWRIWNTNDRLIAVSFIVASTLIAGIIYLGWWWPNKDLHYPIAFLSLPLIIWLVFRCGLFPASVALNTTGLIATMATAKQLGPFGGFESNDALLLLQILLVMSALMVLFIAATDAERRQYFQVLQDRSRQLQDHVETTSEQLEQSENQRKIIDQRFRAMFDAQTQFIGLLSPDGMLLEANRSALQSAGVTREEVINRPFWEAPWWRHDRPQQQKLRDAIKAAANGQGARFEVWHPTADGKLVYVDFVLTPIRDSAGKVTMLVPEGRDITERRVALDSVKESEKRFRQLFEFFPEACLLVANNHFTAVNAAAAKLFGYSSSNAMVGLHPGMLSPEHQRDGTSSLELAEKYINTAVKKGQARFEWLHKKRDGSVFPAEVQLTLFIYEGVPSIYGIVRELSAHGKANEQTNKHE